MRKPSRFSTLLLALLAIELFDELVFGAREAAWPLIRNDLHLSYVEIGLLLSLPTAVSAVIEPFLGILGDTWKRRTLILGGGLAYSLALLFTSLSTSTLLLLLAFALMYPASGAFVSLSQASLMDAEPARHEQNMARWTFAGSIGVVCGPLVLGASVLAGAGWRGVFAGLAGIGLILVLLARVAPLQSAAELEGRNTLANFLKGAAGAAAALKRGSVVRWLVLLEFSNTMLDILYGFLALYFVDVVGLSPGIASLAVAVWSGVGLVGDFLLIPLLERVRGLVYLRYSALLELVLFPAFLLAPGLPVKLVLLGLLGLFNSGWYAILQGRLYSAMPEQSGTVMTLNNFSGLLGSLIPLGIGAAAQQWGLGNAMWLLLAGPIALLVGLGRMKAEG